MSEVNKVVYAGVVLLDLTADTINENVIIDGYTGHDAAGNKITGKLKIITVDEELSDTSENPVQNKAIYAALNTMQTQLNSAIVDISVSDNTLTWTKGDGTTGSFDLGDIKWG